MASGQVATRYPSALSLPNSPRKILSSSPHRRCAPPAAAPPTAPVAITRPSATLWTPTAKSTPSARSVSTWLDASAQARPSGNVHRGQDFGKPASPARSDASAHSPCRVEREVSGSCVIGRSATRSRLVAAAAPPRDSASPVGSHSPTRLQASVSAGQALAMVRLDAVLRPDGHGRPLGSRLSGVRCYASNV